MIIGLQIIALVFSLFMIYLALLNYKKGDIEKREMYIWYAIWIFTIFIIIFPNRLQRFAMLYFARTFDMMVAGGFILVIYMATQSYLSSRKTEKRIEELVRKEALKDVKKKNKK
jgi:hypothetical protein